MLPLGGVDLGYKGFALALIIEALTGGLAGSGRSMEEKGWSNSVVLLLIDPERFGGRATFVREMSIIADACRNAAVAPGRPPVRVPGDGALARRREQLPHGVLLHPEILTGLAPWLRKFGVPAPSALG
jgi:LDH2 family malate/lactate/ureidoglycolate dehydrogenase